MADGVQLALGVTRGSVLHLGGVLLTERALGIHQGVQKRCVSAGQAHHGFVDRSVTVWVKTHGLTYNVCAFGSGTG